MTIKLSTFACVTVTTFLLGTTLAALSAAKTYLTPITPNKGYRFSQGLHGF